MTFRPLLALGAAATLAGCASTVDRPVTGYGEPLRTEGVAVAEMNPESGVRCRIGNGSGLRIVWGTTIGLPRFFVADTAAGSDIYVSVVGGTEPIQYVAPAAEGIPITELVAYLMQIEASVLFRFTSSAGRKPSRMTVLEGAKAAWRTCAD